MPRFISGTESWLNANILSSEIFPSQYQVFHCDQSDGYGGVLFACDSSLRCTQLPLLTSVEAVAFKVWLVDNKSLVILTVYKPPNRDITYMHNLIEDLYIKYKDSTIWITGDFNLPNIDWNLNSVVNNAYPLDI